MKKKLKKKIEKEKATLQGKILGKAREEIADMVMQAVDELQANGMNGIYAQILLLDFGVGMAFIIGHDRESAEAILQAELDVNGEEFEQAVRKSRVEYVKSTASGFLEEWARKFR